MYLQTILVYKMLERMGAACLLGDYKTSLSSLLEMAYSVLNPIVNTSQCHHNMFCTNPPKAVFVHDLVLP